MFKQFPSISLFHSCMTNLRQMGIKKVFFTSKIKLHGTNASVVVFPDNNIMVQARSRVLKIDSDNNGFCNFVMANKQWFIDTFKNPVHPVIIWGEWVGPGIQKGVAVSQLKEKCFAIFGVEEEGVYNSGITFWKENCIPHNNIKWIDFYPLVCSLDPSDVREVSDLLIR